MDAVTPAVAAWLGARHGTVHLVGAGPGDAGLLTLRAAALLATADLVLHDQLVTREVLDLVRPGARVEAVGRRCDHVVVPHEEVIDRMVAAAREGARVVRLKGGDPVVFGRGGEEAQACVAAGVPVELVPGITSAIAGPAAAGIPVTHRALSRGFLVVTAHTRDGASEDWGPVAAFPGTLVVLMGHRRWGEVAAELVAHGRRATEPAAGIACATTPAQQVVTGTLATIAASTRHLPTPATLVVGDVVGLRDELLATVAGTGPLTTTRVAVQ